MKNWTKHPTANVVSFRLSIPRTEISPGGGEV